MRIWRLFERFANWLLDLKYLPWVIVLFALWYIGTHLIVEAVCHG
jgi:hypothetical protein